MNSRLIYRASKHMQRIVTWAMLTDTEWVYCGAEQEINKELVIANIKSHIIGFHLYVAYTREGSFETTQELVIDAIDKLLGFHDFLIWDTGFSSAIEFNHIGVFRRGAVSV
jgi:hypothetical protein